MPNQAKDYVQNIEKKDNLDDKLKSLQGIDDFKFDEFDKNIENSFQIFVNENKDQFTEKTKRETVQPIFDKWLKDEYDRLDKMKDTEIDNTIVKETTFILKDFETLIDLKFFQEAIIKQKEETEQAVVLDIVGVDNLNIKTYNNIDKQDIVIELNKNFKNREEIIKLLKSGKKEDVRKVQYLLIGKNYKQGEIERNGDLKDFGTDGMFGKETLEALKKYVEEKKIVQQYATNAASSGTGSGSVNIGPNSASTSATAGVDATGNNAINAVNTVPSSAEVLDQYDGKVYYECNLDDKIDLTKSISGAHGIELVPPYYGASNISLVDGKVVYDAKFGGLDNFTISVKDVNGTVLYTKDMTVKINSTENIQDNINIYKSPILKAEKIVDELKKTTDSNERRKKIENTFAELSKEYKELLDEHSSLPDNKELSQEKADRVKEIPIIAKALLLLEAETHLKDYLNKDYDILEQKLNENVDYYFGGEYITKEKFLKRLKKGKIDLSKTRFVSLDVELKGPSLEEYLKGDKLGKRNFEIKDLIITDDKNLGVGKGLTKDQEIQYKADRYTTSKDVKEINSERRALKNILGIRGLFGTEGVNEDLSIATVDYDIDNPALKERKNLRKLKKILMRVYKDKDRSVQKLFQEVAKDYHLGIPPRSSQGADKDRQEVYSLYKMYKEDQNCGDYFKKVMGLFENYFVRGIDGFDVIENENQDKANLFTSIYEQEAIGRTSGLIDPDKKRKAVNSIFKESKKGGIDLGVAYENSKELRELKKMVMKIDLSTYLDDPNASKKHKEFSKLYDKYKDSQINEIKDSKGNFVVKGEEGTDKPEDLYYNAAFDFIAGVMEGKGSIVSAINAIKIIDTESVEYNAEKEKDRFDSSEEKLFLKLLADYNKDGRVDHEDRGYVMGLTVQNMYKSVKVDQNYLGKEDQKAPWQNLIEFCKVKMEQDDSTALLSDLEKIYTNDINKVIEEVKKNPGLLSYFQNTLANSPMPIDYIFRYGEKASDEYLSFVLPQVENGEFKIEGLEEFFQKEYKKILDQGLVDTPELRALVKPHFYAALLDLGGISYGRGGEGMTLDLGKAGQFSLTLGFGDLPGEDGKADSVLGLVFSYNKGVKLSKNTKLNFGAGTGSTLNTGFLPIVYGNVGITSRLNSNVNLNTLKAKSAHYFNGGINMTWLIPKGVAGLGGGISLGWSRDKMELIDDQAKTIKESLAGSNGVLFKSLNGVDWSKDKEHIIFNLRENLSKIYFNKLPKALSPKERTMVSSAAENLYSGISYYSMGVELKENDPRLTSIIHDVAEAYAIKWRNDSKDEASKLHVSAAGVSIQMLAGVIPVISFVEFTRYKNLYSVETNQSRANYYERLITGKGMDFVDKEGFYDGEYMTQSAVDFLNAKLRIAHPDVISPALDIKLEQKMGEGQEVKGDVLKIPMDLIKYANINIDSNVANYTRIDEESGKRYLIVPANAKMALMDYSRLNTARFHLIIGDNKVKRDDIQVGYNTPNFGGEPLNYKGHVEKIVVEKDNIDEKIKDIEENIGNSKYAETDPFPIKECFRVENGEVKFELKKDFGPKCSVAGRGMSVDGDSLTMPQTGSLFIVKEKDAYKFYYRSQPDTDLVIDYRIADVVTTTPHTDIVPIKGEDGVETLWRKDVMSFDNVFDKYDYIDRLFDGIEEKLSKMDDKVPEYYAFFMDAASEAGISTVIDENNYKEAFDNLKKILSDTRNASVFDDFSDLKSKIDTTDLSDKEKVMIVDRFKAIFSYHIDLTDGYKDGEYLKKLVDKRGNAYTRLKGYDKDKSYPNFDKQYRDLVVDRLKSKKELDRKEEKNLFGMTAFYRLDNSHEGRSFSMTQMGSTNVLGGVMEKIEGDDLSKAQDWFLNNLDKTKIHKEILKETFAEKLKVDELKNMKDDDLLKLLGGEEIITVDKNGEKIKVQFELDYVFYLLGECANESIGINLGKATIHREVPTPTDDGKQEITTEITEITEGGHWRRVIKGDKVYSGGIYSSTVGSMGQNESAGKEQFSVTAGYVNRPPEPGDKPTSIPGEHTEGGEPPDNPVSNVGEDEEVDSNSTSTSSDHIKNPGNPGGDSGGDGVG